MDPAIANELGLKPPHIYVECKNRDGMLGDEFFRWVATGKPATMTELLVDTIAKATKLSQRWFLVLKNNHTEPWVLTSPPHQMPHPAVIELRSPDHKPKVLFPLAKLAAVMDGKVPEDLRG